MKNSITSPFLTIIFLFGFFISSFGQMKTENFEFTFDSIKYNGIINLPEENEPTSIIIIVPGSGKTNFVAGDWYDDLRSHFVQFGFAVCVWDKAGCGKSEGEFDNQQSMQSSAKEAIEAIEELKRRKIPGSNKIGLWGISRAGWICPLIIQQYPSIAFWISASGTDQFDNYRYLLESNFLIKGRSVSQTHLLMTEWDHRVKVFRKGGQTYDEYIQATKNLFQDPFYKSLAGVRVSEKEFYEAPNYYKNSKDVFDEETGLQIVLPNFENILNTIQCPVLAIFGEKDSQVDWRKTKALYEKTIGENSTAELTTKLLPDCNHNIQKCDTGGLGENLEKYNWRACDDYYQTMKKWLQMHGFIE